MTNLKLRPGLAARLLELQILTATRPGEAAGEQWEDFDLNTGIWIIPAERMNADKEHRVALATTAVALVRSLVPTTPKGKQSPVDGPMFPGVKGRSLTAAAMNLLKELHSNVTAHGFRSTFRDRTAETTPHPREVFEAVRVR